MEEALKAVTVHAAWQYGEEQDKGSITQGKSADFVILDRDPCTVDPEQIRSIRVLRTVKAAERYTNAGIRQDRWEKRLQKKTKGESRKMVYAYNVTQWLLFFYLYSFVGWVWNLVMCQ